MLRWSAFSTNTGQADDATECDVQDSDERRSATKDSKDEIVKRHCNSQIVQPSNLDLQAVTKAYRYFGGVQGVTEMDLQAALQKLKNERLHRQVESQLRDLFQAFDEHGDGFLDLQEFEQLLRGSNLMSEAIYELLQQIENKGASDDHNAKVEKTSSILKSIDMSMFIVVIFNCLQIAIATDISPEWRYWSIFESSFLLVFIVENFVRLNAAAASVRYTSSRSSRACGFIHILDGLPIFLKDPFNIMDVIINCVSLAALILEVFFGRAALPHLQFLRGIRLVRVAKVAKSELIHEFKLLFAGLNRGLKSLLTSFVLLLGVMFMLAIILRQSSEIVGEDVLIQAFSSVPTSMLVIFRCFALDSEGACFDEEGVPFFTSIGYYLSSSHALVWVLCELVVKLFIVNMVTSVFIVQALIIDRIEQEKLDLHAFPKELELLAELDPVLRALIHPQRKRMHPSERRAAQVTEFIQKKHPDVLQHIPNFDQEIMKFAEDIQGSKEAYHHAMLAYESNERKACKELDDVPWAASYFLNGEETLFADVNASASPHWPNLHVAPLGAPKVELMQEGSSLTELLEEAQEVQQHVKSLFIPGTKWASTLGSGMSGEAWTRSNHLCDEAIDPGVKSSKRIKEKADMKYAGNYSRNRDYCRLGLIYDSVGHLLKSLRKLLKYRFQTDGLQVASIENRFAAPTSLGWRDIQLLVCVRVPSSGRRHVMEVQMQLRDLMVVRDTAHDFYSQIRGLLPESALTIIIDQLTVDTTLDLGITVPEWHDCLQNSRVSGILDRLRIPRSIRKDIVEILDADNSGIITSAELRNGLLKCRGVALSEDLIDCKLKIQSMQQVLRKHVVSHVQVFCELFEVQCNDLREEIKHQSQNIVKNLKRTRRNHSVEGDNGEGRLIKASSIHHAAPQGVSQARCQTIMEQFGDSSRGASKEKPLHGAMPQAHSERHAPLNV